MINTRFPYVTLYFRLFLHIFTFWLRQAFLSLFYSILLLNLVLRPYFLLFLTFSAVTPVISLFTPVTTVFTSLGPIFTTRNAYKSSKFPLFYPILLHF